MSGALIAILRKNKTEEIRIALSQFNGHDLINIRVWAEPHNGGTERIPTKAGIAAKVAFDQRAAAEAARVQAV